MEDLYDEIAFNCFRFFGFTTFKEVDDLTIHQYKIMKKALRFRQVDDEYAIHKLAYETFRASATKKQGRRETPVYRTFKQFYDYEHELDKAEKAFDDKDNKFKDLIDYKKRKAAEK